MNRVRVVVHEIGSDKTAIVARQIWEIDPYAQLSVVGEGVTPDNVASFLDGLDVVIEECDSLAMKFAVREHARARRLPVLMATSDRGMFDVERFDLEPDRPLFHGLAGKLTSSDLDAASGTGGLSRANARRRWWFRSSRLTACRRAWRRRCSRSTPPCRRGRSSVATSLSAPLPPRMRYARSPLARRRPQAVTASTSRRSPRSHRLARSQHRSRRWDSPIQSGPTRCPSSSASSSAMPCWPRRVETINRGISIGPTPACWVVHDRTRSQNCLDGRHHAALLALGAATENVTIAAAAQGRTALVRTFPSGDVAAEITFAAGADESLAALLPLVTQRHTNRHLGGAVSRSPRTLSRRSTPPPRPAAANSSWFTIGNVEPNSAGSSASPIEFASLVRYPPRPVRRAAPHRRRRATVPRWIALSSPSRSMRRPPAIQLIARSEFDRCSSSTNLAAGLEEMTRDAVTTHRHLRLTIPTDAPPTPGSPVDRALPTHLARSQPLRHRRPTVTAILFMLEMAIDRPDASSADQARRTWPKSSAGVAAPRPRRTRRRR